MFKIRNVHALSLAIGIQKYEILFCEIKNTILSFTKGKIFNYSYDSFFILAQKFDPESLIKIVDNHCYKNHSLCIISSFGCFDSNFNNINNTSMQIINNTIASLEFAIKNDLRIAYYHSIVSYLNVEKEQMHNASTFRMYAATPGRLSLAFQPVAYVVDKSILFSEALLRIKGFDGTIEQMIISLENNGIINYLDLVVLEQIERCMKNLPGYSFSINVSPNTIIDELSIDAYVEKLKTFSAPPENLIFEITETSVKYKMEKLVQFADLVRGMGFKVAIDDFGSGSTSFKDMASISVDIIKLDKYITRNLNDSSKNVIKLICAAAKIQNTKIVAECIESKEVFDVLYDLGIYYMQGYYVNDIVTSNKATEIVIEEEFIKKYFCAENFTSKIK